MGLRFVERIHADLGHSALNGEGLGVSLGFTADKERNFLQFFFGVCHPNDVAVFFLGRDWLFFRFGMGAVVAWSGLIVELKVLDRKSVV